MPDQLTEATLALVQNTIPNWAPIRAQQYGQLRIDLPVPAGGEYGFRLWFVPDGERFIDAKRVDSTGKALDQDWFSWHALFELDDYARSPSALAHAFDALLMHLLTARTRIRQRRGWLTGSMGLDRETADGTWIPVYGHRVLGTGSMERTPMREHVWFAPAIAPAFDARGA